MYSRHYSYYTGNCLIARLSRLLVERSTVELLFHNRSLTHRNKPFNKHTAL